MDLDIFKIDVLKEIANIGGGHAATALSKLIGKKVEVQVPKIYIGSLEEVIEKIDFKNERICGILSCFLGDLTGLMFFALNDVNAFNLASKLVRRPIDRYDEMVKSALQETANIIIGAYLTAISDLLHILVLPTVPYLKIENGEALITSIFVEHGKVDWIFCAENRLKIENETYIESYLFFAPDEMAVEYMLKKVKEILM